MLCQTYAFGLMSQCGVKMDLLVRGTHMSVRLEMVRGISRRWRENVNLLGDVGITNPLHNAVGGPLLNSIQLAKQIIICLLLDDLSLEITCP